jgi:predicted AAA+ superfamily ATPase
MIKRHLSLINVLGALESCLLLGPRGVGKTVLCHQFIAGLEDKFVVDLLDRETYQQHVAAPGLFKRAVLSQLKRGRVLTVLVDEVQKIPEILDDVHSVLEEQFRSGKREVRFILTGSSARKLKRGSANLLAGRAITLQLHPLSMLEIDIDLERALTIGLLPSFYQSSTKPTRRLRSYADTYIREEVLQEGLVRKGQSFEKFLDFAAQTNSEPVNLARLSKAAGVSGPTIDIFYEVLCDIMLARRIDVWSFSERVKMATSPKYYFFDCGVLNALRGELRMELRPSSYRYGKLFETFLINQILAANDYLENDLKPYFWRTQTGTEIDLILARGPSDAPRAIEIKSEQSPEESDFKALNKFKLEHPEAQLFCLCTTTARYTVGDVNVVPWQEGVTTVCR